MPYILCPDCNKKSLAKFTGDFNRETWAKTYGDKPAPISCFDANLFNACVHKKEAALKADKEAKAKASLLSRREVALSVEEVKHLLVALLNNARPDPHVTSIEIKLQKFIDGDNEFLVLRPE